MRLNICMPIYLSILGVSRAQVLTVAKTYDAGNIFNKFTFITGKDPTDGAVNYLSKQNAMAQGLATNTNNQIRLAVDSAKKVPASQGRPAVRLESVETFSSGLLVADIEHMPGNSCGTWPAMWTYNNDEDEGSGIPVGEVDFLEGTIDLEQQVNQISIHTSDTCSFPDLGSRSNCDNGPSEGDGCGKNGGPYGDSFNANGGGVYATLYADDGITIWFFPRDQIPEELSSGTTVDPSTFSSAFQLVNFPSGTTCSTSKYIKNQTIIINTTFCGENIGDWAVQSHGKCGSTTGSGNQETSKKLCRQYVADHPEDYKEAYWLINTIKLYQGQGDAGQSDAGESDLEEGEPEAGEPEASEPEAGEPEASEPEASEPEASEPEPDEPDADEPDAGNKGEGGPEEDEPEEDEPEEDEPEGGEPEGGEPEGGESEGGQPEEGEQEEVIQKRTKHKRRRMNS